MTTEEIADLISNLTNKSILVAHVPAENLVRGLVANGFPEAAAREIASFDLNAEAGGFSDITSDFRTITNRDPLSIEEWCKANLSELLREA